MTGIRKDLGGAMEAKTSFDVQQGSTTITW